MGSSPKRAATAGRHCHRLVSRSYSKAPIPFAASASRNPSSERGVRAFGVRPFGFSVMTVPAICHFGEDRLRFGHGAKLAERDVPRQVIETTGACDDRLFGREPAMRLYALNYLRPALHIGRLHIDRPDAELLVAKAVFI